MQQTKGTVFNIAHEHTFLRASIWLRDGLRTMIVYRSPVVQDTDPCMTPVYDYLNESCFQPGVLESVADPDMMFGQANRTYHTILNECPGSTVEHVCRLERHELQKARN